MSAGALSDIRVVEYSVGHAGAMCGKAFADLGADVVKVEPPEGDPLRAAGPFPGDVADPESSGLFMYLNANKRGVALDLLDGDGRRRMRSLIAGADMFITDVQPARAAELGIDSQTMGKLDSRLIRVYVTPFGNTGPYRDWKGTDLIAWHIGGMGWESPAMFVTDPENQRPLRARGNQAMYLAGWVAAAGAMCALFHRERYGAGQEVDVSAMDAVSSHIRGNFAMFSYDISQMPQTREKAMFPWIWECSDGYATATFLMDHWWESLKTLMGNPEWADKEEYAELPGRREGMAEIERNLSAWVKGFKRHELYQLLQSRGIPCFPVQSVDEIVRSAHYKERGFFVEQKGGSANGGILQPGPTVRFSGTPWELRRSAPSLGQDGADGVWASGGKRRAARGSVGQRSRQAAGGREDSGFRVDSVRAIRGWMAGFAWGGGHKSGVEYAAGTGTERAGRRRGRDSGTESVGYMELPESQQAGGDAEYTRPEGAGTDQGDSGGERRGDGELFDRGSGTAGAGL